MLVEPGDCLFVRGATPVLLMGGSAVHGLLPVMVAPDGAVPQCAGWALVARRTMCIVDGPGEAQAAIPAWDARVVVKTGALVEPDDMFGWLADAGEAGGAIVLSLERLPAELDWVELLTTGAARGGFMPSLG